MPRQSSLIVFCAPDGATTDSALDWPADRPLPNFPNVADKIQRADLTLLISGEQPLLTSLPFIVNPRHPRMYLHGNDNDDSNRRLSRDPVTADGIILAKFFYNRLFKELHHDRLVPGVHYVPISLAMDELPEVVRYLTEGEGKKIAGKLAINGQVRSRKALKPVVYLYRLMLELARITDPDRKAGES
ncbi:hypothetical protein AC579_8447 [Pseudocercospora musae]|uniref:Glycosyl transferase CAP10 domain-containing protein n=1 Tax=Pseudocercospora musae TaxID=113226 RepID=A0A139I3V3_9PEZI|nr:hypothetical protein AC579_8447 [Pseudocercospora musae]